MPVTQAELYDELLEGRQPAEMLEARPFLENLKKYVKHAYKSTNTIHVFAHARAQPYAHVCIHPCVCVRMRVHARTHAFHCTHMYVHTHVYTCIHTHVYDTHTFLGTTFLLLWRVLCLGSVWRLDCSVPT